MAGEGTVRDFFAKLENKDRNQFFELLDQIDQKGIDLVQFAKQVIVYADQHLLEKVDFYLQISQKLGDLLGVVRRYPHPKMAYKIVFNPLFDQEVAIAVQAPSKKEEKSDSRSQSVVKSEEKSQTSTSFIQDCAISQTETVKTSSEKSDDSLDLSALWKRVLV